MQITSLLFERFRRLCLFGVLAAYVVPAKILMFGMPIPMSQIVIGSLCIALIYRCAANLNSRVTLDTAQCFLALALLLGLFLVISLSDGARDLSIVFQILYALAVYLAALQLAHLYRVEYGGCHVDTLIFSIFSVGVLNAATATLTLLSSAVSNYLYRYVAISENATSHLEQGYRATGFFHSGASTLSMFYALIFCMGLFMFTDRQRALTVRTLTMATLSLLLVLVGIVISGRTGLIMVLIGTIHFLVFYRATHDSSVFKANALKLGSAVAIVAVGGGVFLLYRFDLTGIINWAFELFVNFAAGDGLRSNSTDNLLEMYFLPETTMGTLFGSANFGRSPNLPYIDSDSGYVLFLYGAGVVGLLLSFSIFPYLWYVCSRRTVDLRLTFVMRTVILIVIVGNFKDVYYFASNGITQVMLLTLAIALPVGTYRDHDTAALPHSSTR